MAINFRSNTTISNLRIGPLSGGGGEGGGGGGSLVTSGLIGHWDMGDVNSYPGSGTTVTDLTGNGHNATMTSTTVGGSGTGVYVSAGEVQTALTSNPFGIAGANPTLSISYWFQDLGTEGFNELGGFRNAVYYKMYSYRTADRFRFLYNSSEFEVTNFFTTHGTNWFNATATANNGDWSFYINGSLEGTFTDTYGTVGNDSLYLRANQSNFNWAQTALYDRALTSSEVLQNFNALKSRYGY
jgi:hypothetical protein